MVSAQLAEATITFTSRKMITLLALEHVLQTFTLTSTGEDVLDATPIVNSAIAMLNLNALTLTRLHSVTQHPMLMHHLALIPAQLATLRGMVGAMNVQRTVTHVQLLITALTVLHSTD